MFKRILAAVIIILLSLPLLGMQARAAEKTVTRQINLVYDDSTSMRDGGQTTWCQAKYATEVFAALMEENDTMHVYAMSDYSSPRLALSGADGAAHNASQVHEMLTSMNGTPFAAVEKAYADLENSSADEKWLVIFTDGAFADEGNNAMMPASLNNFFSGKSDDVQVMYLAIGDKAFAINEDEGKGIYSEKATDGKDVLRKLTGMSNRIYNRNKLEVDAKSRTFSFDVPMSELIVFVQGKGVTLQGLSGPDGAALSADSAAQVRYSEQADVNFSPGAFPFDDSLQGQIAYFTGDFAAGDYTVDCENAQTIEVYYKPNVDILAMLTDSEGNVYSPSDPIRPGAYTLSFGFVKPGTDEILEASDLLGDVNFTASLTVDGTDSGRTYENGDTIEITEGSQAVLQAQAEYLDGNSVRTELSYRVLQGHTLSMKVGKSPDYTLTMDGFEKDDQPITVTLQPQEGAITPEIWEQMETIQISPADEEVRLGTFKVEKTDVPGVFHIFPTVWNDRVLLCSVGNIPLEISFSQTIDGELWQGEGTGSVEITDGVPGAVRSLPWLIALAVLVLILLFVLWWMTRKVLPKRIVLVPDTTEFFIGLGKAEGVQASIKYNRSARTLKMSTPPYSVDPECEGSMTITLRPCDRRYVKSSRRRVEVVSVHATHNVYQISISHVDFECNENGKWVLSGAEEGQSFVLSMRNPNLELKTGSAANPASRCSCDVKHL
ncbi:MAG: hypothetical protein IJ496_02845 [Ruminococcus sp.]|nr:hypothetical protein [Ruminococcus sp.]